MNKLNVETASIEECAIALKKITEDALPLAVSEKWVLQKESHLIKRLKEIIENYFVMVTDEMAKSTLAYFDENGFWGRVRDLSSQ